MFGIHIQKVTHNGQSWFPADLGHSKETVLPYTDQCRHISVAVLKQTHWVLLTLIWWFPENGSTPQFLHFEGIFPHQPSS